MTHLPNAPLIYTIGLVRFPPLPAVERFVAPFHDAVRGRMPNKDEIEIQQFLVDAGPQGMRLSQEAVRLWQFATPQRDLALILSKNTLVLHTNSYRDNQTFIETFMEAFTTLVALPGIGIEWVTGVALRYVDLVGAKEGAPLDRLLVGSVLPPPFAEVGGLDIVEGAYAGQYRSPKANVRFQVLRNPPTTLPVDLDTPLVAMNGWGVPRPASDFAVVDTDCSAPIANLVPLDLGVVREHMYDSRCVAKSIFEHIGTDVAAASWKGLSS